MHCALLLRNLLHSPPNKREEVSVAAERLKRRRDPDAVHRLVVLKDAADGPRRCAQGYLSFFKDCLFNLKQILANF